MARKPKTRLYLLSWDNTGLETVLDLTMLDQLSEEEDKQRMLTILADPEGRDPGNLTRNSINQTVYRLMMRARANPQRHYEIYTIQAAASITDRDLWELFEQDPQAGADLIRERGNKIYSDRAHQAPVII